MIQIDLVGGLEHEFYDFPYIGNNHPNWRTHIFQRDWNHQPEMVYDYFTNDHLPYGTDLLVYGGQVGWGPVGHAVVTKLLAKSAGALKISVISEERGQGTNRGS